MVFNENISILVYSTNLFLNNYYNYDSIYFDYSYISITNINPNVYNIY